MNLGNPAPGVIGLADLLDAVSLLGNGDWARARGIAASLGLGLVPRDGTSDASSEELRPDDPREYGLSGADAPTTTKGEEDGDSEVAEARPDDVLPMGGLEHREREASPSDASLREPLAAGIAEEVGAGELAVAFRPDPVPLLRPQWERAVLAAAMSTEVRAGAIDIESLINRVARREIVVEIPRTPCATLGRGVQLLVDRGPGLMPFARDQQSLVCAVRQVVGTDRTDTLTFIACPSRGCGTRGGTRTQAWPAPAPGTPVIVSSDLGAARTRAHRLGASVDEWIAWARRVRTAGCPILAMTPYERTWPRKLSKWMRVLIWDRKTSVQTVRDEIGRWLEVGG